MKKQYLIVKNRRVLCKVSPYDIIYVLRDGRRLIVVSVNGEYLYYANMKAVEDVAVDGFYRPLGRCIVNMNYMRRVDVKRRRLVFINGDELFMGRDACYKMKQVFETFLMEHLYDPEVDLAAEEESDYGI